MSHGAAILHSKECKCLQAHQRAADALSALGHYDAAAKTLQVLKQLQHEQGLQVEGTVQLIQQAEAQALEHPMHAYQALGLPESCTSSQVGAASWLVYGMASSLHQQRGCSPCKLVGSGAGGMAMHCCALLPGTTCSCVAILQLHHPLPGMPSYSWQLSVL